MNDIHNIQGRQMLPEFCPDVVFATPSLSHTVSKRYNRSMIQTTWLLSKHGLTAGHQDRDGDCFVAKARNKLIWEFLQQFPVTQNFFFIDDDVGWDPEAVIRFLNRPEDVIAGAYPKKSAEVDFPVSFAVQDKKLVERDGLYLAVLAATGFMRIKRHVLERLCEAAPTFQDMEPDGELHTYPLVFEAGRGNDTLWWGEDYTFCRKWQEMGGEVWVDPDVMFSHQGVRAWEGRMKDVMWIAHDKAAKHQPPAETLAGQKAQLLARMVEVQLESADA